MTKPYKDEVCKRLDDEMPTQGLAQGWLRVDVPRGGGNVKASDPCELPPAPNRARD